MKLHIYHFFLMLSLGVPIQSLAQTQSAENYLKQGKEKMQQEDYRKAIVDFTISLEIEPTLEAFVQRASAKYFLRDLAGALSDYNNAIDLENNEPVLFNNRGNIKDELRKHAEAIQDYDRAVALDSTYTNAYYNRGIAKYNLQDYEGAKIDFEKVISLKDKDSAAWLGLGLVFIKLGDKDKACANFIRAQQLNASQAEEFLKKYCQ